MRPGGRARLSSPRTRPRSSSAACSPCSLPAGPRKRPDRAGDIQADMTDRPHPAGDIEPRRILVAGDWHGNRYWTLTVITRVPQLLADVQRRLILHLGDFGIWPDDEGRRYLTAVSTALDQVKAELWFIDGNHEDFTRLAQ